MKIYCFGSLNLDFVYHMPHFVRPGETLSALNMDTFPGGKGLNQSVALARAGATVFHVGLVGDNGDFLLDTLNKHHVHTDLVKTIEGPSGQAIIQVDPKGENSIIYYGGANVKVDREFAQEQLKNAKDGDVLILQNEISALGEIVKIAKEKNMKIAFNPSPIHAQIKEVDLSAIHWLLINQMEGHALTGKDTPEEIARHLTKKYPSMHIILTLGSKGVYYSQNDIIISLPAYNVVAIDSTGAGDTFTGFYIQSVLDGKGNEEALQIASAAAAIAVTREGASSSIPSLEEVLTFIEENK